MMNDLRVCPHLTRPQTGHTLAVTCMQRGFLERGQLGRRILHGLPGGLPAGGGEVVTGGDLG